MPRLMLFAAAVSAALAVGCSEPKQTGRIPTSATTLPEKDSAKVLPAALDEFADQAPRNLVQQLSGLPIVRDTPGQVTVILGDINNQTSIVSSTDFEFAMAKMRNKLINSRFASDKLVFVEKRARLGRLAAREDVVNKNPDAQKAVGPDAYDAQTTYTLNGDFYRVARGDTQTYYMEFQLVNFATNQIVFSDSYEVKQVAF